MYYRANYSLTRVGATILLPTYQTSFANLHGLPFILPLAAPTLPLLPTHCPTFHCISKEATQGAHRHSDGQIEQLGDSQLTIYSSNNLLRRTTMAAGYLIALSHPNLDPRFMQAIVPMCTDGTHYEPKPPGAPKTNPRDPNWRPGESTRGHNGS